jgi:mannose-6-phosphate isomerase-like protein (cupin superfamily)
MAFKGHIENLTLLNKNYRKVIFTTKQQQLVLMNIRPKEEIGEEMHPKTSQFIRVEEGSGTVIIGKKNIV